MEFIQIQPHNKAKCHIKTCPYSTFHNRNPNLRSKTAVRTSDTRYFTDPSIATAALGIGPEDLMNDLDTFGLLFETLCVRDLRVFAETLNGDVYHYRDKNGLECDAVVHLRNG